MREIHCYPRWREQTRERIISTLRRRDHLPCRILHVIHGNDDVMSSPQIVSIVFYRFACGRRLKMQMQNGE